MSVTKFHLYFGGIVLACASNVFAYWSEPIFLKELNDLTIPTMAYEPAVVGDGSIIYYDSGSAAWPQGDYLFEAKLDAATGLYSNRRLVTELGSLGFGVYSPWVSADGLRLYYAGPISASERAVKYATRSSVNSAWSAKKTLLELHKSLSDVSMCLTSDELTIVWSSWPANSPSPIYQATRASTDSSFGNIKILSELSNIPIYDMNLSSDGLTLYYDRLTSSGERELWKATRPSIDAAFNRFEPITDINKYGYNTRNPWISPDQKTMWMVQRRGVPGDVNMNGIYVSHWIPEPYEVAMASLQEALALKQDALAKMKEADVQEQQAMKSLAQMLVSGAPAGVTRDDILKARSSVLKSISRQVFAKSNLELCIQEIQKAQVFLAEDATN